MVNKKIGLIGATIICINAMVGVGIFTTPAKLGLTTGPAGILTYIISLITVTFMALSLALLSKTYGQGSFYNYTKQWAGKFAGVITALSYISGIVIAMGLLTKIASKYFYQFLPYLNQDIFGFLIILIISALNIAGVKIMKLGQAILLSCTLGALILTIILSLFNANTQNLVPFMPYGAYSIIASIPAAIFSLLGFESATTLYNIVEDPAKNVPKAIIISVLSVGALYLLFIFSINLAIPVSTFTSIDMPLSQALLKSLGSSKLIIFLTKLISIAILTAICGVIQSVTFSVSSLTHSLFKNLNLNFNFNLIIITINSIILFNFFKFKNMDLLFNLTSVLIIFTFLMSIIALIFNFKNYNLKEKFIITLGFISSSFIFSSSVIQLIKSF